METIDNLQNEVCPDCQTPLKSDSQMEEVFGCWFSQNYYYCDGCGYTAVER